MFSKLPLYLHDHHFSFVTLLLFLQFDPGSHRVWEISETNKNLPFSGSNC